MFMCIYITKIDFLRVQLVYTYYFFFKSRFQKIEILKFRTVTFASNFGKANWESKLWVVVAWVLESKSKSFDTQYSGS